APELLRHQLQGLVPGRFAERLVPGGRCRGAVADVLGDAVDERQVTQLLAHRARRRGRAVLLGFLADGAPRAAAPGVSGGTFVDPAAAFLRPAASDQRPGEPVAVLGEVVAEAALHASRTHVGRVVFDPRAGDAHDRVVADVQVHLAADAAVGAHRAHHLL